MSVLTFKIQTVKSTVCLQMKEEKHCDVLNIIVLIYEAKTYD